MIRTRLAFVAAVAAAALGLTAVAQAASSLTGTVGPGFTITLTQGGKKVSKLKAGTYTIKIADKSNIHNFHLTGPGVNKRTTIVATGATTWTIEQMKEVNKFYYDPHD